MDAGKLALVAMAIMFLAASAMATVSVQEISVTGGQRGNDLVINWVINDDNASGTSDMNYSIWYSTWAGGTVDYNGIPIVSDANAYTVCTPAPTDFTLDANCTYTWDYTPQMAWIPNGTYYVDIWASEIQGSTAGVDANFVNADANTDSNSFTINNASLSGGVLSLVNLFPLMMGALVLIVAAVLIAAEKGIMDFADAAKIAILCLLAVIIFSYFYNYAAGIS